LPFVSRVLGRGAKETQKTRGGGKKPKNPGVFGGGVWGFFGGDPGGRRNVTGGVGGGPVTPKTNRGGGGGARAGGRLGSPGRGGDPGVGPRCVLGGGAEKKGGPKGGKEAPRGAQGKKPFLSPFSLDKKNLKKKKKIGRGDARILEKGKLKSLVGTSKDYLLFRGQKN